MRCDQLWKGEINPNAGSVLYGVFKGRIDQNRLLGMRLQYNMLQLGAWMAMASVNNF